MKRLLPDALAVTVLLAAGLLFRVPALLNADSVNSDTAVVGLQALHILRGEHSRVLWGTHYQGAVEPLLTAAVYRGTGASLPMAMAVTGVLGHLLFLVALYGVARRFLAPKWAFAVAAVLLFAPEPFNFLTYSPPRIWAFALLACGIWALDAGLSKERFPPAVGLSIAGGALVGLAYYSDLFLSLMLPGVLLFGAVRLLERKLDWKTAALALLSAGAFFGGATLRWSRAMQGPKLTEFSLGHFPRAWELMWSECVPFLLGFRVMPTPDGYTRILSPPEPLFAKVVGVFAPFAFIGLIALAVVALLRFRDEGAKRARAFALLGGAWIGVSVVGFLFTGRAVDIMTARYLNPVVLALPVLALAALSVSERRLRAAAAVCAGIVVLQFAGAGWRSYGPWTEGLVPRADAASSGVDERRLLDELKKRGVEKGVSDFWIAYRLMALWNEELVVVPTYSLRYGPHLDGLWDPGVRALILMDGVTPDVGAYWRSKEGTEEVTVGRYHAFVMKSDQLSEGLVRAAIEPERTQLSSAPGAEVSVPARVKSLSGMPFRDWDYRLGAHLKNVDGTYKSYDLGGAPLGELPAGGEKQLELKLRSPTEPGRYTLELDLVKEGWWWFSERGNPVAAIEWVVE